MKRIRILFMITVIAMTLSISACASSESAFSDISENAWYAKYIDICYSSGLMQGIGAGKFDPDGVVTIAQMKTVCARLHHMLSGGDGDINVFYEKRPDSTFFFTDEQGNIVAVYTDIEDTKETYGADSGNTYFYFSEDKLSELRDSNNPINKLTLNILHRGQNFEWLYVEEGNYAGTYCYTVDDNNSNDYITMMTELGCISIYEREYAQDTWYGPVAYYDALYFTQLSEQLGKAYSEFTDVLPTYVDLRSDYNECMNAPCPRAYLALYLAVYIPEEDMQPIRDVNEIPDLNYELVRQIYNSGIMGGIDNEATFDGHGTLTRAQLAAIVARIINPDLRLK